jgi:hypothetical protein
MDRKLPGASYAELCRWIRRYPGFDRLAVAIVAMRGATADECESLLGNLERFHVRSLPDRKMVMSQWERSEFDAAERIRTGVFESAYRARKLGHFDCSELFLLVLHGHHEKARPLLREWAEEHPHTTSAFWARWVADGEVDIDEAKRLAIEAYEAASTRLCSDVDPTLYFVPGDPKEASDSLVRFTTPRERVVTPRPVRTRQKVLVQLLALWHDAIDRSIVRQSFRNVFGADGPSSLRDRIGLAYLYGRYVDTEAPAHELVAAIKPCIPDFAPRARRMREVRDDAMTSTIDALREVLSRHQGMALAYADGDVTVRAAPPLRSDDFI